MIGVCNYFIEQFLVGCKAEIAKRRWLDVAADGHKSARRARRKTASIRCRSADVAKPNHARVAYVSLDYNMMLICLSH